MKKLLRLLEDLCFDISCAIDDWLYAHPAPAWWIAPLAGILSIIISISAMVLATVMK